MNLRQFLKRWKYRFVYNRSLFESYNRDFQLGVKFDWWRLPRRWLSSGTNWNMRKVKKQLSLSESCCTLLVLELITEHKEPKRSVKYQLFILSSAKRANYSSDDISSSRASLKIILKVSSSESKLAKIPITAIVSIAEQFNCEAWFSIAR